jgi:hypothetical protein
MGYRPIVNCTHIDGFRRCRIHRAHWLIRWLVPKGRAYCVEERRADARMQDDDDIPPCPDVCPTRPAGPPGMHRPQATRHNRERGVS